MSSAQTLTRNKREEKKNGKINQQAQYSYTTSLEDVRRNQIFNQQKPKQKNLFDRHVRLSVFYVERAEERVETTTIEQQSNREKKIYREEIEVFKHNNTFGCIISFLLLFIWAFFFLQKLKTIPHIWACKHTLTHTAKLNEISPN